MTQILRRALPLPLKSWLATCMGATSARAVQGVLDPEYYRNANTAIAEIGADAGLHFRRHGLQEGRRPSAFFSQDYVYSYLNKQNCAGVAPPLLYAQSDLSQKPRLVFVSHDASRTGAPAIILRLLEMFSTSGLFECFSILDAGGERHAEFKALSHTYQMSHSRHEHHFSEEAAHQELAHIFRSDGIFQGNAPVCALVNSAESCRIGRSLNRIGVPVVSLLHEIAAYYAPEVFADIAAHSQKVIFPSDFVSRAAVTHCDLDLSKTLVRGQGLLEDDFGTLDQNTCRRALRERLGIEEDAFVILNVGTMDIRKGADMFADIAKLFYEQPKLDKPVYFVWHGAEDATFSYAQDFILRHALQDRVRLLPSTSEIEQVFLGGDVFLLTARADPFPCVVHEAMACGLPVVAFRNGGGAPELIGEDSGTIIEMGDLAAAVAALRAYVVTPELLSQQGRAAQRKIAQHWDYRSYCQDVYDIIQQNVPDMPLGGWPALPSQPSEPHLVVMRGCDEDLKLLHHLGLSSPQNACLIVLLDGRFGSDAARVTARLKSLGLRYHVCQPAENTAEACTDRLLGLLKNPKPQRVTFINTQHHLSDAQMKPLAFPKAAVQTAETLSDVQLYRRLPNLDRLYLSDTRLVAQIRQANPMACDIVQDINGQDISLQEPAR